MPTRNVVLTDHQAHFVEQLVTSGRYQNASEVLREGTLKTWEVGEDGLYAYLRQTERETVLCALNTSERAIRRMIRLPEALAGCKAVRDLMTGKTHNVQGGYVTLALGACEGAVLGRAEA